MATPHDAEGNILSGLFYSRGKKYVLSLTTSEINWKIEGTQQVCGCISLGQLIAVHPCDCSAQKSKKGRCQHCVLSKYHMSETLLEVLPFHAMAMRLQYVVPHGKHSWKLESQVFYPGENAVLKMWLSTIQNAILEFNRPRRLLVFINPFGGKKKGLKIYERKIAPLFHLAGIDVHAIITQRKNHAKEMLQDINLEKFDGIVCVGGDGSFNEILDGVILKTQKESEIDINDSCEKLVSPSISFGIIPAGSTNAAAYCTMGTDDPVSAALLIIMGDYIGVDVCALHHQGKFMHFVVTALTYGYFGDLVVDSNKMRILGPKRYEVAGFKKLMGGRHYSGEFQLKVETELEEISSWEHEQCRIGCSTCMKMREKSQNAVLIPRIPTEKQRWKTVRCQFMAIQCAIMSCACARAEGGLSPTQHLGNGYCDVIVVSTKSRLNFVKYLLRLANNSSTHNLDFVQVHRVKEFIFNPLVTDDKTPETDCTGVQENYQELKNSVWSCDGEIMPELSIYAKIHCQLVNVFGRGLEDRSVGTSCAQCCGLCRKDVT